MLRRKEDVGSGIANTIGAETLMSPNITGSAAAVRNPDIKMTPRIEMSIVSFKGNLGSSMCAIAWSAPSQDPHVQGA